MNINMFLYDEHFAVDPDLSTAAAALCLCRCIIVFSREILCQSQVKPKTMSWLNLYVT